MKVLVTGGAGFLGRWFVKHHIEAGDDVLAIDDLSNPHSYWTHKVEPYAHQEELQEALSELKATFDLAYHFAAPVGGREKISNDPMFNADSLRLDSLFFRWAVGKVGTVVYPSSSAVYPVALQEEGGQQLQEGMFSATNPNWLAPDEMYGFSKMCGEYLAHLASRYGLNTLCIRPFSGYGEGQSMEYPVPSIARRAINREDPITIWGPGSQRRDFVHVSDIVGATLARLSHGINGYQTMNIGSGWAASFDDIARICAGIVGYHPEIEHDETKPVGVMLRFADVKRMDGYYREPRVGLQDGLTRVIESLRGT